MGSTARTGGGGKMASTARLLSLQEGPASYQLVGRVTAYQGDDG